MKNSVQKPFDNTSRSASQLSTTLSISPKATA